MTLFQELYAYREMVFSLVRRDLKGRYKGSVLGFFWTFLNPLLQLCVYTMVFSIIMRNGIQDFYLFLFVALVPWLFFSTSVSGGASCIWQQQDMVKKIYFPREVLPIAYVTSQFVNMLLSLLVVLGVLIVSGKGISLRAMAYLPIIMLVEYMLALGFALIVSSMAVYVRDLQYFMGIVTLAWQFMTPIMYGIEFVPERFLSIFYLNPMTPVILAYLDILYYKKAPDLSTLLSAVGFGIVLLVAGFLIFGKLKRHFAEEM
jgi:ABC-2 type transport system permease protein